MNLISARSISLDSTFNHLKLKYIWHIIYVTIVIKSSSLVSKISFYKILLRSVSEKVLKDPVKRLLGEV
jgi:hypothetical protein